MDMLTSATVADVLRPYEKKWAGLYDLGLIIAGSVVIALSAQLAIPLPFSPIPVTGQTFAVLMIGALFGARRGVLSVLAYIIEGAAGLPVFAMGTGGPGVLVGPRGGYLLGFVFAACAVGFLAARGWGRRIRTTAMAMVFGNMIIYAFGLLWLFCLRFILGVSIGNTGILAVGLYPFIIGDILKTALAAALLPSGWKLLKFTGFAEKRK